MILAIGYNFDFEVSLSDIQYSFLVEIVKRGNGKNYRLHIILPNYFGYVVGTAEYRDVVHFSADFGYVVVNQSHGVIAAFAP